MMIRKGPFGHFAVESIDDSAHVFEYAMEIIDSGKEEHFLPAYLNRTFESQEIAFDFSGYIPVNEFMSGNHTVREQDLRSRRKAVAGLFLSIYHALDILLNPALIFTDPKYIFTDEHGTQIKVCFLPVVTDKTLRLSSVNSRSIERLLTSEFFNRVLTEDEIDSIVYSIANNNEEMLVNAATSIKNTPVKDQRTKQIFTDIKGKPSSLLVYSLISSLTSLIMVNTLEAVSFMASVASLGLLGVFIYRELPVILKAIKGGDITPDDRSKILFDDSVKHSLNCALLESVKPVDGSILKYAVYQDLTTIGSDRFLSDLFIKDESVDPIHAQLFLTQDTVYLSDCSSGGKTFINDRSITPDVKHEIKDGQKITIGDVDLIVRISFC